MQPIWRENVTVGEVPECMGEGWAVARILGRLSGARAVIAILARYRMPRQLGCGWCILLLARYGAALGFSI